MFGLSQVAFSVKVNNASKRTSVRVLNWWNYMDQRIVENLNTKGFDLDISIYHSNEVALSRLLSKRDDFDIAIVSNINLDLLLKEDIFDKKVLKAIVKKRPYNKMILSNFECVPYMWGTTIYAYDARTNPNPPKTLKDLKAMEKKGFKVGVLDDAFEMSARILGDNFENCSVKNFDNFFSNVTTCGKSFSDSELGFTASDFLTSSDEFLKQEKVAVYTWQGGVFMNLKNSPWLKFSLSSNYQVIGADYVCVLKKNSMQKDKAKKIQELVDILTNKKNTELNVETSQYFSPYRSHTNGLHPYVKTFYSELMEKLKYSKPIFLTTPNSDVHKKINEWWKKVRYEIK